VVATETDHLTFLGRLANQHATKVPSAFHRPFQCKGLLFLGFPLDAWHHRLVLHVFQSLELKCAQARSLTVRTPESPMETLAWECLNTPIIHMDPNDFAASAREAA
jgi:hypothetical protein